MTAGGERASCLHEVCRPSTSPRHLVAWSWVQLGSRASPTTPVVIRPRSLNGDFGLGSSLRRPATAKALPIYLQEPTYLRMAGTAGQCQKPTYVTQRMTRTVAPSGLSDGALDVPAIGY